MSANQAYYSIQTGKVIEDMARFCPGVSCIYSVRGNNQPRGSKLTQQVVIGTPGTTLDWALKLKFFDPRLIKVNADLPIFLPSLFSPSPIYSSIPFLPSGLYPGRG